MCVLPNVLPLRLSTQIVTPLFNKIQNARSCIDVRWKPTRESWQSAPHAAAVRS